MKNLFVFFLLTTRFLQSCTKTESDKISPEMLQSEIDPTIETRLANSNTFKDYCILKLNYYNSVTFEILTNPNFSEIEFLEKNKFAEDMYSLHAALIADNPTIEDMDPIEITRTFNGAYELALSKDKQFNNIVSEMSKEAEQRGPNVYEGLEGSIDCPECYSASGCPVCETKRMALEIAAEVMVIDALADCGTQESAFDNGFELGDQFIEDYYGPNIKLLVGAVLTGLAAETGPFAPVIGASGAIGIEVGAAPFTAFIHLLAQEICMLKWSYRMLLDSDIRDAFLLLNNCCYLNSTSCC